MPSMEHSHRQPTVEPGLLPRPLTLILARQRALAMAPSSTQASTPGHALPARICARNLSRESPLQPGYSNVSASVLAGDGPSRICSRRLMSHTGGPRSVATGPAVPQEVGWKLHAKRSCHTITGIVLRIHGSPLLGWSA